MAIRGSKTLFFERGVINPILLSLAFHLDFTWIEQQFVYCLIMIEYILLLFLVEVSATKCSNIAHVWHVPLRVGWQPECTRDETEMKSFHFATDSCCGKASRRVVEKCRPLSWLKWEPDMYEQEIKIEQYVNVINWTLHQSVRECTWTWEQHANTQRNPLVVKLV